MLRQNLINESIKDDFQPIVEYMKEHPNETFESYVKKNSDFIKKIVSGEIDYDPFNEEHRENTILGDKRWDFDHRVKQLRTYAFEHVATSGADKQLYDNNPYFF